MILDKDKPWYSEIVEIYCKMRDTLEFGFNTIEKEEGFPISADMRRENPLYPIFRRSLFRIRFDNGIKEIQKILEENDYKASKPFLTQAFVGWVQNQELEKIVDKYFRKSNDLIEMENPFHKAVMDLLRIISDAENIPLNLVMKFWLKYIRKVTQSS